MTTALIGFSGFVGQTLLKQRTFEKLYRSTTIADIEGECFQTVVCCGAPAQKWLANLNPEQDRHNIEALISHLQTIQCETFVLISTVDVFTHGLGVDEDSPVDETGLNAYGLNRRLLEKFVECQFPHHLIVRLPGLVGPGLRKNVIYDFLTNNNIQAIDSRGVFQFYPMVNLWYDIEIALQAGLKLVHLNAAPLSVSVVSEEGFGKGFDNRLAKPPASYDMQTKHAALFGTSGRYLYSVRETLQAVRAYAQSRGLPMNTQTEVKE